MGVIALGLIGVIVGVVSSEFLRKTHPELVKKIEDSAKRFTDRVGVSRKDVEDPPASDE